MQVVDHIAKKAGLLCCPLLRRRRVPADGELYAAGRLRATLPLLLLLPLAQELLDAALDLVGGPQALLGVQLAEGDAADAHGAAGAGLLAPLAGGGRGYAGHLRRCCFLSWGWGAGADGAESLGLLGVNSVFYVDLEMGRYLVGKRVEADETEGVKS